MRPGRMRVVVVEVRGGECGAAVNVRRRQDGGGVAVPFPADYHFWW